MQNRSSFRTVNLVFLIVLCLQAANLFFFWMPQYVRMILNEAIFVFLPAYLYLRLTHQPVSERVRWQWPGWKVMALSLLIGLGLYPFSAASAGIIQYLLGYTSFATPPDAIPTTVLMSVLAVVAYAGMAPLCEEFLFRGVIQPVYERRGPKWAVVFVGFLFIIFHLSLLQGLSIILLALALGYVNYRSRSLPASIVAHFGANILAALVITQGVFKTGIDKFIFSVPVLLAGMVMAVLALVGLIALTRRAAIPSNREPAAAAPSAHPAWLSQGWPLLVAGLLYLSLVGIEFYYSRSPEPLAAPLLVSSTRWEGPQTWKYEIRNIADTVVGDGECLLVPGEAVNEITCSSKVIAYEVKHNNGTFMSSGGERIDRLRWQTADGRLISGGTALTLQDGEYVSETNWTVGVESIDIDMLRNGKEENSISLPYNETPLAKNRDLIVAPDNTWPWQLAGIKLELEEIGNVVRFNSYTWRNKTQDSGPLAENRLVAVVDKEEVTTPAGEFTAWKVMLGEDQTAWYDVRGSHTLVKFFNGIESWSLMR